MIYAITLLINSALALAVFFSNKRRRVNKIFALLVVSIVGWIGTLYLFYFLHQPIIVYELGKLNFAFTVLIGYFAFEFSIIFPDYQSKAKSLILFFRWETVFLTLITLFTSLVDKAELVHGATRQTIYGPLYYWFVGHFLASVGISVVLLIRKSRFYKGLKKAQVLYIQWGFLLGAIFGSITNIFLPLLGISAYQASGPLATVLFVVATTYAIIRHRLLDIRLVLTRSIIYGFLLAAITLSFVVLTLISGQFFSETPANRNYIALTLAFLIVFGLDPLKNLLSRLTDRIFFKAKVDYQFLLRQISEILAFEINRDELIRKIRIALKDGLKVKYAVTLLRKQNQGMTEKFDALSDILAVDPNMSLRNDSALIEYLRVHKHPSLLESLERKIDDTAEERRGALVASKEEFERTGAALAAPIYAQDHLIAVLLLGPKLSGDTFSNDDLNLIEVLAPQIGSAIQKANLFEEVRGFSESLKVKVEEATEQLQERNVSLETLQNITKDITQTLDFNRVVQDIADSVSTKLGYIGAVLVFLDDDGKTVRARAITETPLTKKAMSILPIRFDQYTTDLSNASSNSLGHKALRTGEIQKTESFADVISPPLPRVLASTIQKLLGMKSMVLVPIVSEGKTIGVIEIGTQKKLHEIDADEIATMQAMADELGVVSRNIRLFDKLRQTNAQLEVANKHLQELDRAKSEFVSIASHQLRTPMTGIMGYLSMMTQGDFGKMAPEHQKILTDLLSESQRMIRLINQFLNVSKIEAGKFTYQKAPVQITDLISREIKETQKAASDKGLQLSFTPPKQPLPVVTADADKLQDVILNLIDNAIKYTAKGTIAIGAEKLDDHVHVWVKDSGIGIKKEDAPELFNKFVRGSGIAQIHPDGSGLGLFIAKSIIDNHGGRIWTESEGEGKGSTFQFVIPITPPATEPSQHPAAHVVKPRDGVEQILHSS